MSKLESLEQEIYEGFYKEIPEFEIIRPYVAEDVAISISLSFFANAYIYIVMTLSKMTQDKDKAVATNAMEYLKRILNYMGSLREHKHALGADILNGFAYNLYKVGGEYDRILSYAPEAVQHEVSLVSEQYDKPNVNSDSLTEYQSLVKAVEKIVRERVEDS